MKLQQLSAVALMPLLVLACTKSGSAPGTKPADAASPSEAQTIATDAYIYAYPMLESYRTMYAQAIDRTAPGYLAPFNELTHKTQLLGPDFTDIVRPNNDTMYSMAWLDLRAQPVVITVPRIEDRYFSVQLVDMFTHNFAYMGTRATGGESGSYLVAGPGWEGTPPRDTQAVFLSESEFVYCLVRIEARGPDDVTTVDEIQRGFRITPLHVFLGHSRAPAASGITFPAYDADRAKSAEFIDLLGFLLAQTEPKGEGALMERFAKIGIRPGAVAVSLDLTPAQRQSIDAGVGSALLAIGEAAADPASLSGVNARNVDGWQGVAGVFGNATEMRTKYLVRAAAAMFGLFGNDVEEAYYPAASTDAEGNRLDGSLHAYTLRFEQDQLPMVDAFWSMTMYSLPDQLMIENRIHRYSIGDRSSLQFSKDGSLTIYIQRDSPGKKHESNWLPAPDGPFSIQFRMYLPKPKALNPLYVPPGIQPAR